MNSINFALQNYLYEILDLRVELLAWEGEDKLPFFLRDLYTFFEVLLLNKWCLLMIANHEESTTPALIKKHSELITQKINVPCIFVQNKISGYNRKRLIQHHVPFIIPNNQFFFPDLGIDLRERFLIERSPKKKFSPATQALVIYVLVNELNEKLIPSELAKKLGYTFMTMTRAFNELESAGVAEIIRNGKERWWIFNGNKKAFWEKVKIFLLSPVKTRVWLKEAYWQPKILAGLSALANATLLNPPPIPIYAIGLEDWKLRSGLIQPLFSIEEALFELEVWNYNPNLFEKEKKIDSLSLYLSLEGTQDERAELALQELLDGIKW